jgi:uncharacterized protein YdeI (YjbR/CyaY-like superfamily)
MGTTHTKFVCDMAKYYSGKPMKVHIINKEFRNVALCGAFANYPLLPDEFDKTDICKKCLAKEGDKDG